MSDIRPFRAIRPRADLADRIAALPYDVYSREEARRVVENDPYTFLRIDRAETQFPPEQDMYAPEVYQKAHDMLWDMIGQGQFIQDDTPCFYIYEQVMNGRHQIGIVAVASADDYRDGVIKKHENTREEKELDRIRHVDACDAQTGPIFLAYRKNDVIEAIIRKQKENPPVYEFVSDDNITHIVYRITDAADNAMIREAFAGIGAIYIADGHHRCASAVKVCNLRREGNIRHTGEEEYNYCLSVLFADEQLMIMDYNRVVKDLNGLTKEAFLEKIAERYTIQPVDRADAKPAKKGQVGMYLDGRWYCLNWRGVFSEDPVDSLDVSILQKEVLEPILGIADPKVDSRIDFVGGIRGLQELERRVQTDCAVAFAMYPTDIHELFRVADAGLLMPPKSTWFEPKLRSGLFIHSIR